MCYNRTTNNTKVAGKKVDMNTDFRLKVGIFKHPKIVKLRRRLGYEGSWAYLVLLEFTTLSHPDGRLTGMSNEDIAIAADYEGDPDTFVDTLKEIRLLDTEEDGTITIHDWAKHNPYAASAEQRSVAAKNAAISRWAKPNNTESMQSACDPHTEGMPSAMPNSDNRNAPSPSPSPSPSPNPTPEPKEVSPKPEGEPKRELSFLSEDWEPTAEMIADAEKKYPLLDIQEATASFVDYWVNETDPKKGMKVVWSRAWWDSLARAEKNGYNRKKPKYIDLHERYRQKVKATHLPMNLGETEAEWRVRFDQWQFERVMREEDESRAEGARIRAEKEKKEEQERKAKAAQSNQFALSGKAPQ